MALERFKAEQVGYCCAIEDGVDGHMEMSGREFCGNATRAYGMLTAKIAVFAERRILPCA